MLRSSGRIKEHQTSKLLSTTRQNFRWFCFVAFFFWLPLYLVPILNHAYRYSDSNHRLARSLSTGRYHHRKGIVHMRSVQSARIATTATIVLFRRFNAISSFQLVPSRSLVSIRSAASSTPSRPAPNHSSPLQTPPTAATSFSSIYYQTINHKSLLRRHSSTFKETEDDNKKAASFSVPDMGTAIDNDGSFATNEYTGYEKWVRRLYATNMFHPVKLGLENMHLLHKLLGNPMDDVSTNQSST